MAGGLKIIIPMSGRELQNNRITSTTTKSGTNNIGILAILKRKRCFPTEETSTREPDTKKFKMATTSGAVELTKGANPIDASTGPNAGVEGGPSRKQTLSDYVLDCLSGRGLCVLDNFMGQEKAKQILNEVKKMDESKTLTTGLTVSNDDEVQNVRKIRQDKIAFIDKDQSKPVDDLILKLDSLMTHANQKMKDRKRGRPCVDISGRTKAMISCYPGNGTHYVRHVDNHNKDGRSISVVYYVNPDWDVEKDGGLLKVYPQQASPLVAKISPIMDRLILFWSDERNPHEVLPAFRNRYAITVWYFDKEERARAVERHQALGEKRRKLANERASDQ